MAPGRKARTRFVPANHDRVEPGDAIGVAIRIPHEHRSLIAELLAPRIPRDLVMDQGEPITLYPTVGRDRLDGRPVSHRWVNVLGDPPDGVPTDQGLGGLACIGVPRDPINRMWERHGLRVVPGRLRLSVDLERMLARGRIVTAGGAVNVEATLDLAGEPWAATPQSYYALQDRATARLLQGDEWGVRHDGSGSVTFARTEGDTITFDTYVGLDTGLGWDYEMPAWQRPIRGGRPI